MDNEQIAGVSLKGKVLERIQDSRATTFGEKLDDTYAAAKKRLENPPRLNIYVPPMKKPNELGEMIVIEEAPVPLSRGIPEIKFFKAEIPYDNCNYKYDSIKTTPIKFKTKSNQTLIYCNQPEAITDEHLKDGYILINRVIVKKEKNDAVLYMSHQNDSSNKLKLAVRIYNDGSVNNSPATIEILHQGINTNPGTNVANEAWEEYKVSPKTRIIRVPPNEAKWMVISDFDYKFLEVLVGFTTDKEVVIGCYFCIDENEVPGPRIPHIPPLTYPTVPNYYVYSGEASKNKIETSQELKASNMLVSNYKSYFYKLCAPEVSGNTGEDNPITLVQKETNGEDIVASSDKPATEYGNLGNYGLEYYFTITLRNDTDKPILFNGYIISNPKSHCVGIAHDNVALARFLGKEGEGLALANDFLKYNRWKFCESTVLLKGESVTAKFSYMHLSKGSKSCLMQWEALHWNSLSKMHVDPS